MDQDSFPDIPHNESAYQLHGARYLPGISFGSDREPAHTALQVGGTSASRGPGSTTGSYRSRARRHAEGLHRQEIQSPKPKRTHPFARVSGATRPAEGLHRQEIQSPKPKCTHSFASGACIRFNANQDCSRTHRHSCSHALAPCAGAQRPEPLRLSPPWSVASPENPEMPWESRDKPPQTDGPSGQAATTSPQRGASHSNSTTPRRVGLPSSLMFEAFRKAVVAVK